jgi:hypothetical protein
MRPFSFLPIARLAPALLLAAAVPACGGATFDGTVYRGDGFAFRIPHPPESWTRIEVGHAALAYRDLGRHATVAVNGRCRVDGDDVPLASLTQHLFLQFTERAVTLEETVPFDGREALHTVLLAKLDGVPHAFDVWVLKKDGCVFDLYYLAPPDRFPDGSAEFDRFVRGFATVPADAH